jgi:hypothetical protein
MNPHAEKLAASPRPVITVLGIAVIAGLYASSLYSYLLFHSLVELFSILVAFVIFVLAWNTRRVQDNHYLLFLGIALLFTGALEMVHTLSYKDFGVFPGNDANLPTQFWIAFRYLSSASFLVAPLFIRRTLNVPVMVAVYAVGTSLLIGTIFMGIFPDCFVEGGGLTPFKIVSEYVIIAIFLASLGLLFRERSYFDRGVLRLMIGSILASVLAELSFTQYVSVFGPANMIGHFFLLASMVFIYRAIIVTGIVEPSRLLFRNLKQSEAALRESEEKYRSLFEHMINGFAFHKIIAGEAGKPIDYVFLEANPAFERLTGLKQVDITGRRVREVLPGIEKDASDWIGTYGRIALTGQAAQFEQYAEALGKWYSVSAYSPMKGYFATVFEDITERKLAEEALRKAHDVLEQRVRARTSELARTNEELETEIAERVSAETEVRTLNRELEQRVIDRTAQLETANKELESFSYSVSHDLRAPLRSIEGFTQAIEEEQADRLDHAGRDYLRRVRAAALKMTRLIDAMLDLSRLSSGELRRVSVDLSALAEDVAKDLRRTQPERVVEFVIPRGLTVEGDAVMLRAVVENLLGNAWKFTGKRDTPRIEFGAVRLNGSCAFFVRDNGAGFDTVYAGRLFGAFQRLHSTDDYPGFGIGLATVQRILHRHGGRIWAEGEPEKGATFYFTLG